jgi:hypothetical protein
MERARTFSQFQALSLKAFAYVASGPLVPVNWQWVRNGRGRYIAQGWRINVNNKSLLK